MRVRPLAERFGTSLGLRLTLFSALFVGTVLLILGLLARNLISSAIEQQWRGELQNRLDGLVAYQSVLPMTSIDPGLYGELYSGNYWEVDPMSVDLPQASISLADFSLFEQLGPAPRAAGFLQLKGPLGEPLLAFVADALPQEAGRGWILIARDRTELDLLLGRVKQQMVFLELLIWVAAIIATALATRMGARPVRRLGSELQQLARGQRQSVGEGLPSELKPLAQTVNQVMRSHERRLRQQRESAANLAHELKTPLSALQQQTELHTQVDAGFVRDKVARMWEPLEQELARARVHGPSPGLQPACVATELERAIRLCCTDHAVSTDDFQLQISPQLRLPLESRDLFTVLWNLLDNAVKHGGHPIIVDASPDAISVADSGTRTGPVDNAKSGAGLRLVEHILQVYDWELNVDPASQGGRRCTLSPKPVS